MGKKDVEEKGVSGGLSVEAPPLDRQTSRINDYYNGKKRRCRNLPFLFAFIAFWIGMIINSGYGWNKGDPRR